MREGDLGRGISESVTASRMASVSISNYLVICRYSDITPVVDTFHDGMGRLNYRDVGTGEVVSPEGALELISQQEKSLA